MNKARTAFKAATVVQQINIGVLVPLVSAMEDDGFTNEEVTLVLREIKRQVGLLFEFLDSDMTSQELINELESGL